MAQDLQQDSRAAILTTPLGKDKLALTSFDGSEALSELFEFRIDALSSDENIDFDQVLGRSCCVRLRAGEEPDRYFDGVAVEAQAIGMRGELHAYRLILRPSLWLLTRATNCRIWHEKTALDIIKEVLGERQIDYRVATTRNFPKLEYSVQYRETDFAFVSRLMEQHGIYYFFEHSDGGHTMALGDSPSSHKPVPGHASMRFATKTAGLHDRRQRLLDWSSQRRFRTGKVELRDYNFKQPNADMKGDASGSAKYTKSNMEYYDYPGKYDKQSDGKDYANVRLDAEQTLDHRRFASGEAPSFFPGGLFTLTDHPTSAENARYLIIRCSHHYSAQLYRSSQNAALVGDRPYHGSYELAPADQTFRAPIVTPKPIVHGPQTAKVVPRKGSDGEEIDVDDDGHGRIKVRFYWDRDDKRSCWLRVAQIWAGGRWGGQFIPRVGMEVVVEFLEGDPDRPLVVGAVYNGDNKYPYGLPDNKTQSGVKSNSSKGGAGYNEFMFEDAKNSEEIRMHAQKDFDATILHAETREIGENFETPTGSPSRKTTLKMGDDELNITTGSRQATIAMNDQLTVNLNRTTSVLASDTTTVGTQSTTAELTISINATVAVTIISATAITLEGGGATIILAGGTVTVPGPMLVAGPLAATGVVVPPI